VDQRRGGVDEEEIQEYFIERQNKSLRTAFDNGDKDDGYRAMMLFIGT
jgi:hypothetical protein